MSRILIIEDTPEVQNCLSWVVGKMGHEAVTARNGDEGVRLVEEDIFALIISDLHMPGSFSDVSLIRKLRELSPETPIIVVSGYPTEMLDDCYKLGVEDFLVKPFELSFVSEVINRILGDDEDS